jgi:DNA modification methylase
VSWEIRSGHVLDELRKMPDNAVHCVVTSPPYWGLRDYGTGTWSGGDPECKHLMPRNVNRNQPGEKSYTNKGCNPITWNTCGHCGAARTDKQYGLEETPEEYIANQVEVFREVRRVLRGDGTCWLNMGDCYATGGGKVGNCPGGGAQGERWKKLGAMTSPNRMPIPGLKPKDLVGLPWLLAFALRADGWYLRAEIIWSKRNPMPESVTDRPTKAHEQIFLLSKSETYFYDAEAIKEPASLNSHARGGGVNPKAKKHGQHSRMNVDRDVAHLRNGARPKQNASFSAAVTEIVTHRNKRSVWTVATHPFREAHYATFPPKLIEPCILASTSQAGCCSTCGRPFERIVESTTYHAGGSGRAGTKSLGKLAGGTQVRENNDIRLGPVVETRTLGWDTECCRLFGAQQHGRCVVLDPYSGAGTTGLVAERLGRDYIGIELNPESVEMSVRRIRNDQAKRAEVSLAAD